MAGKIFFMRVVVLETSFTFNNIDVTQFSVFVKSFLQKCRVLEKVLRKKKLIWYENQTLSTIVLDLLED